MNHRFQFLLLLLFVFMLASCQSTKGLQTRNSARDPNKITEPGSSLSLTDRLRTISGVSVVGYQGGAKIRIRGSNSITSDTEPLFLLNEQVVNGGYATLYGMVDIANIKSITVLKDSSSTAEYGLRGSNGVIKIELK